MKPVAASPVLHHARALGRAFRAACRAMRWWETWFLLLALGVALPWTAVHFCTSIAMGTLPLNARYFGVSWYTAFVVGVHAVALVALLGLLVPLLEGDRLIRPGRLRPPAVRLFGLAGVFAGVEVSGSVVFALGWRDPTHLLSCAQSVGRAWVVAGVILALRVRGPWPWSAGHLLTAGALWWVAQFAIVPIAETLDEWLGWEPEAPTWLPPTWWIVWRFGNLLVTLVVLEYLRSSPAAEPAEPAP